MTRDAEAQHALLEHWSCLGLRHTICARARL